MSGRLDDEKKKKLLARIEQDCAMGKRPIPLICLIFVEFISTI
jgi:hypothetical protein